MKGKNPNHVLLKINYAIFSILYPNPISPLKS